MRLRLILGIYTILLGAAFFKIKADKEKDTFWGRLYRKGKESRGKTGNNISMDKIYTVLGWLAIIAGSIVLLFGFRMHLVGN